MRLLAIALLPLTLAAADIPAGTRLLLTSEQTIAMRSTKVGDHFWFRTAHPVLSGREMLLPAGTSVRGRLMEKKGRLTLRFETIALADGRVAQMEDGTLSLQLDPRLAERRARAGPGFPVGAALGAGVGIAILAKASPPLGVGVLAASALSIATHVRRAKDVEFRAGTNFDVVFDRGVAIP